MNIKRSLIDTHAHICDEKFDNDRAEILARAKESGIETIVEIGESPDGWGRVKEFLEKTVVPSPFVVWSCGFHPHYAEKFSGFDFDRMKREASSSARCVAIGEIGLDYVKSPASKEMQIALFRKTLEIAVELKKPVVIHCRQAQRDSLDILKSFFNQTLSGERERGVIHCFSGDLSFAEECLNLGFCLGVDGPITYPSAKILREVISRVPLERIVLETDSPYLPPQDFRGKRNESSYLTFVATKLAELFNKSIEEISRTTTANAKRLFQLS